MDQDLKIYPTAYDGGEEEAPQSQEGEGTGTVKVEDEIPEEKLDLWGIKDMDPEQRASLVPHLQRADANHTKRMQELSAKYKPYEELGDIEQARQFINFAQDFQKDPKGMVEYLAKNHSDKFPTLSELIGGVNEGEGNDLFEEDDPYAKQFSELKDSLEQLKAERESERIQQSVNKDFDSVKGQNYPYYDEAGIGGMSFLSQGDVNKGFETYKQLMERVTDMFSKNPPEKLKDAIVQSYLESKKNQGPTIGSGTSPNVPESKEIKTFKDSKKAAEEYLAAIEAEGG